MNLLLKTFSAAVLAAAASSCSSFINVNQNPNNPTTVAPNFILAQALAATATNYSGAVTSYNSYGSLTAAYWGKSGVVNGFTDERTYNYSSSTYSGLWTSTYDNLQDYQLIQTQGATTGYPNHAAIARIMKVYNFLLLVDEYGDVPYTNALQGLNNLNPTYDKAADIYKDFIVQLNGAISDINSAASNTSANPVGTEDVVFSGNMTKWKQFANSLKLRILMRESQTNDATLNAYVATQMSSLQSATDGFITTDVQVQPGYAQSSGQQNPFYNTYGLTSASTQATYRLYQLPTRYILKQLENNKDPRESQLYQIGQDTLNKKPFASYVGANIGDPNPPLFSAGTAGSATVVGSRFLLGGGLLKGYNAATPLMLLAEQNFLKAEAETRGLFTGGDASAATDYKNGIEASFLYFYRPAGTTALDLGSVSASTPGYSQFTTYTTNGAGNSMVDYSAATSSGSLGKQSVILFQKYLAMNTVSSIEAWDDYRRAAQPKIPVSPEATIAGKLPTRLLYPITEQTTNSANVPTGVTQYTKIFWDVVD